MYHVLLPKVTVAYMVWLVRPIGKKEEKLLCS